MYNLASVIPEIIEATTEDPSTADHINRLIAASNTLGYYIGGMIQNVVNKLWVCNDMAKNIY